ncbi:hypothetical protein N9R98_00115 [bacterium]|nr:hypothetical protein [bacterium]
MPTDLDAGDRFQGSAPAPVTAQPCRENGSDHALPSVDPSAVVLILTTDQAPQQTVFQWSETT